MQLDEFAFTNQSFLNLCNHIFENLDDAKNDDKIFQPPAEISQILMTSKQFLCDVIQKIRHHDRAQLFTLLGVTLTNSDLGTDRRADATNIFLIVCALTT